MTDWLVMGGGMRGIAAAVTLARAGRSVVLLDAGKILGGVLCSEEWHGLYVDKGCHILDFNHRASGELFCEMLGDNMHPVDVRYASINRGLKSDGIAVPDMSLFDAAERKQARHEIETAAHGPGSDCRNVAEVLRQRYGATAGDYLTQCAEKICGYHPSQLAPEAFETMPMLQRVRIGPDPEMELLKQNSMLDERLAVSTQDDPWRFYPQERAFGHRNAYPSQKGMRGFCEAATDYLSGLGVDLRLGHAVEQIDIGDDVVAQTKDGNLVSASRCYWSVPSSHFLRTIGSDDPLREKGLPASIILYSFRVRPEDAGSYTYIHDFSAETLVYRASTAGIYGRQVDGQGQSYVSAEVPTKMSMEIWQEPEVASDRIWQELQSMELVSPKAGYTDVRVDKTPFAYVLAGIGWSDAKKAHVEKLQPFQSKIVFGGIGAFGKAAIFDAVRAELDGHI